MSKKCIECGKKFSDEDFSIDGLVSNVCPDCFGESVKELDEAFEERKEKEKSKNKRYFTNPLTIESFEKQFSGENWPLAFSTGQDVCNGKYYAVTTDHVNASRTDPVCAAELAMLFSKANKMYNLIKDVVDHGNVKEKEMKALINNLENEIEEHRKGEN